MAEYQNPYDKYVFNKLKGDEWSDYHVKPSKRKVVTESKPPPKRRDTLPALYPSRSSNREPELWRAVKQVWDDCQALGWDEEDTAEALFGIVEELIKQSTEDK